MSHYTPNVRDLEFNLFEFFRVERVFGEGGFSGLDIDTATAEVAGSAGAAGPAVRPADPMRDGKV